MEVGTVLVLGDVHHASEVGGFANGDLPVLLISADPRSPGTESARICAEIARRNPPAPLSVVAFGDTALHLPRIALAQRASHRRISEYVLVRPTFPPVTDSWPDAPVTVYCAPDDPAAQQARLRGWPVHEPDELAAWRPAE